MQLIPVVQIFRNNNISQNLLYKLFLMVIFLIYFGCFISAQTNEKSKTQTFSIESTAVNQNYVEFKDDLKKVNQKNDFKGSYNFEQTHQDGKNSLPTIHKVFDNTEISASKSDEIQAINDVKFAVNEKFSFKPSCPQFVSVNSGMNDEKVPDDSLEPNNNQKTDDSFRWIPALKQSLLFLGIQHGYAFTQPKTRRSLKGKFFKDYFESVKSLHGWDDGGRFFTNYIAHSMQGSFMGFVQVQNDPKGIKQRFGLSGDYWRSRTKAFLWSAAWSTQFEIGPVSQASIGNVGLKGKQTWGDIITTPTVGTAMLITEDAFDRFLIERIERKTNNFYVIIISRVLLNPTRTVANLVRFRKPWYRDRTVK